MPNTSKKANVINVKNLVYCLVTADTSGGTSYGSVKDLARAMQIQVTASNASGVLYGDGVQQENIAKLTGLTVALDVNKIPIETRAELLGNTYDDGILIEQAGDEAPYIALGYMTDETNGENEYVWLLKGRATPMNESVQQTTESVNFSTASLTLNFIARDSDKQFRYYADTANADFTSSQAAAWFATGPSQPVS